MPERRLEGRGGSATATPSVDEEPRKGRRGRKDSRCEDTGEQERAGCSGKRRVFRMGGAVPREEARGWQDGAAQSLATAAEEAPCCRVSESHDARGEGLHHSSQATGAQQCSRHPREPAGRGGAGRAPRRALVPASPSAREA